MTASLEARFHEFLATLSCARNIDATHHDSPREPKRADYILHDGKLVAEIKSLNTSQIHKGNSVIDGYLKETGIEVFGTLPLSSIARSNEHLESIEKTIYIRMTRNIEKICKSANEQIKAASSKTSNLSTGLLIILNEDLKEMDPYLVARRVWDYTHSKQTSIHYCLLIFETHTVNINGLSRPYPLLMDLTYSARQRRTMAAIRDLQQKWAMANGYPNGLPEQEPKGEDFYPNGIVFGG